MAVSEKEDGATGERTLTRITGATGATRIGVTWVTGSVWSMEERPEKMYGLFDLNHHLLEKMCDVTSVTEDERTEEEEESGKVSCILVNQKPQLRNSTNTTKKY